LVFPGTLISLGASDVSYLAAIHTHCQDKVLKHDAPVSVTFCDLSTYETNFVATDIAGNILTFIRSFANHALEFSRLFSVG
jgi:hypothetical protein